MANLNNRHVLFILLLLYLISCNNLNIETNIHGNWKGIYNGQALLFIFKSDKTCVLTFVDKQSNAIKTITGKYELDLSKKPIPLTIRNIPQLNHPLYTIVEFINDNSMKIAEFSPKWKLRPITFEIGKIINLKRVKLTN